jgi:hypothetical protein
LCHHLGSLSAPSFPPQVVDADHAQPAEGQVTVPSPHSFVYCPSCGHVMRRGPIIRPSEHAPPEQR